jgi:ankyrin repeat protein
MSDVEIKNEIEKICFNGDEEELDILKKISDHQQDLTAFEALYPSLFQLIWATEKGHVEIVRLLISKNVSLNQRNTENKTALLVAIDKGNTQIIDIILSYFMENLDIKNNNHRELIDEALLKACEKADLNTAQKLVEMGANINCNINSCTPLSIAIDKAPMPGLKKIVEFLLDRRVEIEQQATITISPLFNAIIKRQEETIRLLIERGAQLNITHLKESHKFPSTFSLIAEKLLEQDRDNFLNEISTIRLPSLVNPALVEKLLDKNAWINIEYNHLNIQMNNYVRRQRYYNRKTIFGKYDTDYFEDENDIEQKL